jgi:hypothetical protein
MPDTNVALRVGEVANYQVRRGLLGTHPACLALGTQRALPFVRAGFVKVEPGVFGFDRGPGQAVEPAVRAGQ